MRSALSEGSGETCHKTCWEAKEGRTDQVDASTDASPQPGLPLFWPDRSTNFPLYLFMPVSKRHRGRANIECLNIIIAVSLMICGVNKDLITSSFSR